MSKQTMGQTRGTLLNKLAHAGAVGLLVMTAGCFDGYEGVFIEGADVELDIPGAGFRTDHKGEAYQLVETTATQTNRFVAEMVKGMSEIVSLLNQHRETSRDGAWRVYGPFDDDQGRNLAWLVRIEGDAESTQFEVLVGARGSKQDGMDMVLSGGLDVDGDIRKGEFKLDFDSVQAHPEMREPGDTYKTVGGAIVVTFFRDVATERKDIEIDFQDFREEDILGESWFSDESYAYNRDAGGAGTFHLAVSGSIDDEVFSGERVNRLLLDAMWNEGEQGRVRARVLEVENEESALEYGDYQLDECFGATGELTWRALGGEYAVANPLYAFGEESSCVFSVEVFEMTF